jgi:SAM-dependent methyltransferase
MLETLRRELHAVADFYDQRLVGDLGPLGFRRTTELGRLLPCLPALAAAGILNPSHSRFLDLGCGDGRVNVLMSYVAQVSVGVELEDWLLDESTSLREQVDAALTTKRLRSVPRNIHLFCGDATDWTTHAAIQQQTGIAFAEFDVFYTFLTAHEVFSTLIAAHGKPGCAFLVYGMDRIFPRYDGLDFIESLSPLGGVLAVYRKPWG